MTNYRRSNIAGASYFFTVNLDDRSSRLLTEHIALRWRLIKTVFSRSLPRDEDCSASRKSKGERGIWQRRYWEHLLRDDEDFARHVDYIHINPVKHGCVKQVVEWPHSSFHRYVRAGTLPMDWAGKASVELDCGERELG